MTIRILSRLILLFALASALGACGGTSGASLSEDTSAAKPTKTSHQLVVGFAQIGAESGWRTVNFSIQETA